MKTNSTTAKEPSPARPEYEGDGDEVRIEDLRTGRTAFLNYEERVPCIRYETVRDKDRMDFRVSSDGNAVQLLVKGIPRTQDEIATVIIS
jgi:hypothetical protein